MTYKQKERIIIILFIVWAACKVAACAPIDIPHVHKISNVDTTQPYKLRWQCSACGKWLETIEVEKIDYTF
jgi:hypothetical protein